MNRIKDQLHLEKVILNPINRSQERYSTISEYVKKNAKMEHWESERTGKTSKILSLNLPTEQGMKNYHACLDFQEGKDDQEKEEKARKKITEQIFSDY